MTSEHRYERDSRMQRAIEELQVMIQKKYPTARFAVASAEDNPHGIHLIATVDVADTDDVLDLVMDRLLDLQADEQLPLHVSPTRPLEQVLEEVRGEHHQCQSIRGGKY